MVYTCMRACVLYFFIYFHSAVVMHAVWHQWNFQPDFNHKTIFVWQLLHWHYKCYLVANAKSTTVFIMKIVFEMFAVCNFIVLSLTRSHYFFFFIFYFLFRMNEYIFNRKFVFPGDFIGNITTNNSRSKKKKVFETMLLLQVEQNTYKKKNRKKKQQLMKRNITAEWC